MALPILGPPAEELAALAAPVTPGCAAHAKRWVLAGTVLASSVVFLAATVINVALPAIQSQLNARVATMQWIASTYTLALAALTLVGGLGDARALAAAVRTALADAFHHVALLAAGLALAAAAAAALWIDGGAVARAAAGALVVFTCEHLGQVLPVNAAADGCVECLRTNHRWIHLRLCLACGHVGCCDASANQHATRHFRTTGHAIIQSLQPGETWRWCYLDEHVV